MNLAISRILQTFYHHQHLCQNSYYHEHAIQTKACQKSSSYQAVEELELKIHQYTYLLHQVFLFFSKLKPEPNTLILPQIRCYDYKKNLTATLRQETC